MLASAHSIQQLRASGSGILLVVQDLSYEAHPMLNLVSLLLSLTHTDKTLPRALVLTPTPTYHSQMN